MDQINVRAVEREKEQPSACCLEGFTDLGAFVAREVVHNDEIAWDDLQHKDLLEIGPEGISVDRALEHKGGDESS